MVDPFLEAAIEEARLGEREGGIPIGSVLVIDGRIVGRGHNRRIQRGSAVLHAEMDCLENAGRLRGSEYAQATLYSTLSPCDMCSGAVLLYGMTRRDRRGPLSAGLRGTYGRVGSSSSAASDHACIR
jgi:cytosine deaminase